MSVRCSIDELTYEVEVMYVPETDEMLSVGGVEYTIKAGVVFDAKALLSEVRRMIQAKTAASR